MNFCLNSKFRYFLLAICVHSLGCVSQPGRVVSHALPSDDLGTAPTGLYKNSGNAAKASSKRSANKDEPVSANMTIVRSEEGTNATAIPENYFDSDSNTPEVSHVLQKASTVRAGEIDDAATFAPMPTFFAVSHPLPSDDMDTAPTGLYKNSGNAAKASSKRSANKDEPVSANMTIVRSEEGTNATAIPENYFDSDSNTPEVSHVLQKASTVRAGSVDDAATFAPMPAFFAVSHPLPSDDMDTAPTGLYEDSGNAAKATSQGSANKDEPVSADLTIVRSEESSNATAIPGNYFDSDSNTPEVSHGLQQASTVRAGGVDDATTFAPMPTFFAVSHALPSDDMDTAPTGLYKNSGNAAKASSKSLANRDEPVSANMTIVRSEESSNATAIPGNYFDSDSNTPEVSHGLQQASAIRAGGVNDTTAFAPIPTFFADGPIPAETAASDSFIPSMVQLQGQYMIESGDTLEIKFRVQRDLNEIVNVRPDGMISLQIVGDFPATGFTCEQLRQGLIAAYSDQLQDPDIAVIIRTFASNGVYIGGEVNNPGRVPLNGRITTLQAIILAGGFKDTADQKRIVVRHGDGTCCEYDLKCVAECSNGLPDVVLKSSDIVYVPKSHIAKVNLFVEQYIDKVLPFSRSFGVFINQQVPGSGF